MKSVAKQMSSCELVSELTITATACTGAGLWHWRWERSLEFSTYS